MQLPGSLSRLNDDQYHEMLNWLSIGCTDVEITKRLIDEGFITDVKQPTLLRTVNRWRKSSAQKAIIKQVVDKVAPMGRLRKHFDVLEEMTELALKQRERIAKLDKQEGIVPLLLESMSNEMMRYLAMMEKLGKLQLETGVLRRVKQGQIAADYEPEEDFNQRDPNAVSPELEAAFMEIEAEFERIDNPGTAVVVRGQDEA